MRLRRWIGSLGTAGMLAVIGFLVLPGSEDRLLAQNRKNFSIVSEDSGHVALGLAIRRLGVAGTFMQAPAHPDDETNALFALFTLGQGMRIDRRAEQPRRRRAERDRPGAVPRHRRASHVRAALGASHRRRRAVLHARDRLRLLVRSAGSHRQVGPRRDRRRLRAADPHAAARRAADDEHPGRRRRSRARGDDRARRARRIAPRAIRRAIPSNCAKGCAPWQPKKLYFAGGGGRRGGPVAADGARRAGRRLARRARLTSRASTRTSYDALLGRTYAEIGTDARSNHKCQGTGSGVPPLPGVGGPGVEGRRGWRCGGTPGAAPAAGTRSAGAARRAGQARLRPPARRLVDLHADGHDHGRSDGQGRERRSSTASTSVVTSLADFAGRAPPRGARDAGSRRSRPKRAARRQAFDTANDAATVAPIERRPHGRAHAARPSRVARS